MKNTIKLKLSLRIAGIIALAAVIGFTMTACKDAEEETLTYTGYYSYSSTKYVLGIRGDAYTLTSYYIPYYSQSQSYELGYTSKGNVIGKQGTTYTLKPAITAATFTATVTSAGLVELAGSIRWDNSDGSTTLPGQLSTSG